jgi:hypothetical protein
MSKIITKVDRVSTVEEAIKLQGLDVDVICISLSKNINFIDSRDIAEGAAFEIIKNLSSAKPAIEIAVNDGLDDVLNIIEKLGANYLQPLGKEILPIDFKNEFSKRGVGIIYSDIHAAHDDDPSWILSHIASKERNNCYYQIDILGDIENSWEFLRTECPKYPEDLQINDINNLAEQYPLLITLDFSADNLLQIIQSMPNIKGVSMILGDNPCRNDIHHFQYSEAVKILEKSSAIKR